MKLKSGSFQVVKLRAELVNESPCFRIIQIPAWASIEVSCATIRGAFGKLKPKDSWMLRDVEHSINYADSSYLDDEATVCGCCRSLADVLHSGAVRLNLENRKNSLERIAIEVISVDEPLDGMMLPNCLEGANPHETFVPEFATRAMLGEPISLQDLAAEAFSLYSDIDHIYLEHNNDERMNFNYLRYMPAQYIEEKLKNAVTDGLTEMSNEPNSVFQWPALAFAVLIERQSEALVDLIPFVLKAIISQKNIDDGSFVYFCQLIWHAAKIPAFRTKHVSLEDLDFIAHSETCLQKLREEIATFDISDRVKDFDASDFAQTLPSFSTDASSSNGFLDTEMNDNYQASFPVVSQGYSEPRFVPPPKKEVDARRNKNKAARKAKKSGKRK